MNIDQFWQIVERVHAGSPRDMEAKCRLLAEELRALPSMEIQSFDQHLADLIWHAYSDDLWGAAFVINNGCSDDKFMDFRSTLISLGRSAFENALKDPESLVEVDIDPAWAQYQGYQSVPHKVYDEITGDSMPDYTSRFRKPLAGRPFEEWAMSARYPKLVAKYGYKDSSWLYLKERAERFEQQRISAERLANVLLDSGLIPSCGLIPQFRVAAPVLRTGQHVDARGRQHTWQPFEPNEGDYWGALSNLGKLKAEELSKFDIHTDKLTLDIHGPPGDDFNAWIKSLKQRGLM